IAIRAEALGRMKRRVAEITASRTGQPLERILADGERDRWFTAEEARAYGFVDHVVDSV
ncbi:ClpP family protease, partial [Kibdelosporangium lantanae]